MLDFGIGNFCTLIISAEVKKCIIIPVSIPLFELALNGQALLCLHAQLLFCEIPQLDFLRLRTEGIKVEESRISGSDEGLYTCKPAGVMSGPGSEDQIYLTVIQTPLVEER